MNESAFASVLVWCVISLSLLHFSALINSMVALEKLSWRYFLIIGRCAPFIFSSFWKFLANRDFSRRIPSTYLTVLQASSVRNSGILNSRQCSTAPLFILKAHLMSLHAATILVPLWYCSNWFVRRWWWCCSNMSSHFLRLAIVEEECFTMLSNFCIILSPSRKGLIIS